MKQKVTTLILVLLLASMFVSVFTTQTVEAYRRTGTPPLRGDVNYDGIVDRKDIAIVVEALFSYPGHPRWNPMVDLNQDDKVNHHDLTIITHNVGTRWIPGDGLSGEISIGALLPLSGPFFEYGENELAAALLAVEEVNEFLATHGAGWTLNLVAKDTYLDPDICLDQVEDLNDAGVTFVVGPLSSGETNAIQPYCEGEKILTISHGSTDPFLAIEDYIFRFIPPDKPGLGQGPAIGRLMYDNGKRYVIPVWADDFWWASVKDSVQLKFEGLGGTFLEGISYDPFATDLSDEVDELADIVWNAIIEYGVDQVAVLHLTFYTNFMSVCLDDPVLDDVKWYGSMHALEDEDLRNFAMAVEYLYTSFTLPKSTKYETVRQHCLVELGREPDPYAYIAYDAVWAIAYCLITVDAYDSESAKATLPTVVQNYFGASGWITLDEYGDKTTAYYDIWQILEIDGTYEWTVIGTYTSTSDSILWY